LLCGSAALARAGGLLKTSCGECQETAVKIPAQRVVVQTMAPKVSVQQTTVGRGVGLPAIGTVYMPLAMPTGFGVPGATTREAEAPVATNPWRGIPVAELARLQYQRACAVAKAALEAANRAYERASPCAETPPPPPPPSPPPADAAAR